MKRLFRFPWRTRRDIESDVDTELRFHLEERTAALVAGGMDRAAAREQAMREFGDVDDARRYIEAVDRQAESNRRRKDFMGDLAQDITYAVRKLRSAPAFAMAVVLTLAVGIGANTTVLNLMSATLLRPPPVRDVDHLAWIQRAGRTGQSGAWSGPGYLDLRAAAKSWTSLTAFSNVDLTLGADEPVRLSGFAVAANYFDVLGVRPNPGRGFVPREDSASGAMPIVLSHDTWMRRFNGDSSVVGRTIAIDMQPVTVVGVAPKDFVGLRIISDCDFWVPFQTYIALNPTRAGLWNSRGSTWMSIVGRLAAGVTLEQAAAETDRLVRRIEEQLPKIEDRRAAVIYRVRGGLDPATRARVMPIFSLIMLVPLLVLGVACANVANLFVSRSIQRQKEFGVRRALGASRGRLVRQLLTECAILGVIAGGAGLAVSYVLTGIIRATGQLANDVSVLLYPDVRVFLMTFGLALVAGVVFGLVPVLAATNAAITPALKNDGFSVQIGRGRHRLRNAFVVSQVAMSLTLLITAGLFVGSLRKALSVEPGFDPARTIAAYYDLGGLGYDTIRVQRFHEAIMERARNAPGVEAAAVAEIVPLSNSSSSTGVSREESSIDVRDARTFTSRVSPGFFTTMRIPIVRGRGFDVSDNGASRRVAIVNEQLAQTLWPSQNPIGKRMRIGGNPWVVEVVGVARNGKARRLSEQAQESYFWLAYSQFRIGSQGILVVRGKTGTADAVAAARSAIKDTDHQTSARKVETLEEAIAKTVDAQRAGAALLAVFGTLALLLAGFGIFGVIAQGVAARTREIGIRMSLGARAVDVVRSFVREGLALTVIGAAIGVALSLAASKVLSSLLFGLTATDGLTFAGATAALIGIAALASFVPARRAARVDPLIALRSD